MKLKVQRKWRKPDYTIGRLYINDIFFCNTLEDKDRGLTSTMSLEQIKNIKIKHETCIPYGTYKVTLNVYSPTFGKYPFYKQVCNGNVPRLLNVKGFDGILIHVGDGSKGKDLTSGCLLIGENKIVGGLLNGKETFKKLYSKLKEATLKGEEITIEITQ